MPPSGYTDNQSQLILGFLRSISTDLKNEGLELAISPCEALRKEVDNINIITANPEEGTLNVLILEMTKWFYEEILKRRPLTYDEFDDIRETLYPIVEDSILSIHVPILAQRKKT